MKRSLLSLTFSMLLVGLSGNVHSQLIERDAGCSHHHHHSHCHSNKDREQPIESPPIYQNPFMALNNFSEIHNNSYQTDTTTVRGPGRSKKHFVQEAIIGPVPFAIAGTIAFNSSGQILTIRSGQVSDTQVDNTLLLINAESLEVITSLARPSRTVAVGTTSFGGGGYFYLNNSDQVVCVTADQHIRIYSVVNNLFVLAHSYDLTAALNNPTDILGSLLPDSLGNIWFVSEEGSVGYIQVGTGTIFAVNVRTLPGSEPTEINSNSFASDENGGVYIITDYAVYRFSIGLGGVPTESWRQAYDRGTRQKPGQTRQGSGTTPTLFNDFAGNQFLAITDNADPFMHVLVYNRNTGDLLIQHPIFKKLPFLNSNENSLVCVNHSIIVENNYGNVDIKSTLGTATTEPGLLRVDFNPTTGKARTVWNNYDISIPSVVSKLSLQDGLIYTYAKDTKGWYWAALDYRTGKLVSKSVLPCAEILSKTGPLVNNFYSGIAIGPDGSAYVGVFGGIIAWRKK